MYVEEFVFEESAKAKPTAIVVEDQPIIWDYARSCLEPYYNIVAFCSNTSETEMAFKKFKPDLVWLDCYLGEISEISYGVKNSGMELAAWIKSHDSKAKIFLFTASTEMGILRQAQKLKIEGIALGGKYIKDKSVIMNGISVVSSGKRWVSPGIFNDLEIKGIGEITVFEYCVISALILGKTTSQIAEELDATRKVINNSLYRIKEKFGLSDDTSRQDLLEFMKDKFKNTSVVSDYYNISDLVCINTTFENCLEPIIKRLREGDLNRTYLKSIVKSE
jgi:DNA-binding NarL/FixJ family response regulator